jgi:hypothetical protein
MSSLVTLESALKRRRIFYETGLEALVINTPTAFELLHEAEHKQRLDRLLPHSQVIRMCHEMGSELHPMLPWHKEVPGWWMKPLAMEAMGVEAELGFLARLGLGAADKTDAYCIPPDLVTHMVQRLVFWGLVGGRCNGDDTSVVDAWFDIQAKSALAMQTAKHCYKWEQPDKWGAAAPPSWTSIMEWLDVLMSDVERGIAGSANFRMDMNSAARSTSCEILLLGLDNVEENTSYDLDGWLKLLRKRVFSPTCLGTMSSKTGSGQKPTLYRLWTNIRPDWIKRWFTIQFALLLNVCRARSMFNTFKQAHATVRSRLLHESACGVYIHRSLSLLSDVYMDATAARWCTTVAWKSAHTGDANMLSVPVSQDTYYLSVSRDSIIVVFPFSAATETTFVPVARIDELNWHSFPKASETSELAQIAHRVVSDGLLLHQQTQCETHHSKYDDAKDVVSSVSRLVSKRWTGTMRTAKNASRKISVWLEVTVRHVWIVLRCLLNSHLNVSYQNPIVPIVLDYLLPLPAAV